MPTDLVKRINLSQIYPPLLEKLLDTLAACRDQGAYYYCTLGFRSVEEQDKIFAQGRTAPGKKVTNAPGGLSCHNYGLAVDHVRDGDLVTVGLQPEWDAPAYDLLKAEGTKRGLQVGVPSVPGGDPGHAQLPLIAKTGKREKVLLSELKSLYQSGGLKAVWAKVDEWGPWT